MIAFDEQVLDTAVLEVQAESLDAATSKSFRSDIQERLRGQKKVVLDLSKVAFIDSSGLGALISFLRQLSTSGGDLKLCGLRPPVRALFELVRMHRLFSIYNSREEAIRAFQ